MFDLGLREARGEDQFIFRCGCLMLVWPWKDGQRAVKVDGCGKFDHFDTLCDTLVAAHIFFKTRPDILSIIRYERENLADVQEME